MNRKFYRLLHGLLIVMLTITPLRAVLASGSFCNMSRAGMAGHMMSADSMTAGSRDHQNTEQVVTHRAMVHDTNMMSAHAMDKSMSADTTKAHQCCCCDGNSCNLNQCDMGFHLTVLLQPVTFAPVFVVTGQSEVLNYRPVFREIHPPFRPPLKFS